MKYGRTRTGLFDRDVTVSSNVSVSLNEFISSNLPSNEALTSSTTSNVFEKLKAYIDIIVRQRDEMQQEIVRLSKRLNEQCDKYKELHNQYRQFRKEIETSSAK